MHERGITVMEVQFKFMGYKYRALNNNNQITFRVFLPTPLHSMQYQNYP